MSKNASFVAENNDHGGISPVAASMDRTARRQDFKGDFFDPMLHSQAYESEKDAQLLPLSNSKNTSERGSMFNQADSSSLNPQKPVTDDSEGKK